MAEVLKASSLVEIWAGYWKICSPDKYELFEERAAIMEYDGGLPREQAENEAYKIVSELE